MLSGTPKKQTAPKTLQAAIRYFSDPDTCVDYMQAIRWPDGVACPSCGSKEVRYLASRHIWECKIKHPKRQFSAKVGTVFEDSAIGLDKWFLAVWLLANCKNGISSYEVARDLGVTQKTGWFMLHRIRLAMQQGSILKLGGPGGKDVEVDETFIGGKARMMNAEQRRRHNVPGKKGSPYAVSGKALVLGMLERGGKIVTKVVRDRRRGSLLPHLVKHIEPKTTVHTDELGSYAGLVGPCYEHQVIDHTAAYVDGNVHTNGIENFCSLLKRELRGTYVSAEPFHLFRYLDEQSSRFNERKNERGDAGRFVEALSMIAGKRLTYLQLIGGGQQGGHPAMA
jgi:transposase-like protein